MRELDLLKEKKRCLEKALVSNQRMINKYAMEGENLQRKYDEEKLKYDFLSDMPEKKEQFEADVVTGALAFAVGYHRYLHIFLLNRQAHGYTVTLSHLCYLLLSVCFLAVSCRFPSLYYFTFSMISTSLHLLSLDSGLVSITLTLSPMLHSFASSWAFNLYVLFTIFP